MDFFVRHNENTSPEGPFPESRVREMLSNGELPDTATYWHEQMDDWRPAKELTGPVRIVLDIPDTGPSGSSPPPVIESPSGAYDPPQPVSSSQGASIFSRRRELFLGVGAAVVLSLLIGLGIWLFVGGDPLYHIKQGDEWGYIDSSGKEEINPQFDDAKDLLGDLGPVKIEDKWGYVNRDGEQEIPPQFTQAFYFTEGLARVQLGTKWGYINEQGNIVIKEQFDAAYEFYEGLAPVMLSRKYGYIDKKGDYLINPQYEGVSRPGPNGQNLPYDGSLLPVRNEGKWGYINEDDEWVIKAQFESARPFINGMAAVRQAGKYGYIGKDGKYAQKLKPQFQLAQDFTSDLAPVMVEGKWAFINKSGDYVVNPRFDRAEPFYQGLAVVGERSSSTTTRPEYKMGYINENGKFIIKLQFKWASSFLNGPLAQVKLDDDRMAYIDKKGKIVWEEQKINPISPDPKVK